MFNTISTMFALTRSMFQFALYYCLQDMLDASLHATSDASWFRCFYEMSRRY